MSRRGMSGACVTMTLTFVVKLHDMRKVQLIKWTLAPNMIALHAFYIVQVIMNTWYYFCLKCKLKVTV